MQGSGLMKYWGISEEQRKDSGEGWANLEVRRDRQPLQARRKVSRGPYAQLDTAIIHVQKASPTAPASSRATSSTTLTWRGCPQGHRDL